MWLILLAVLAAVGWIMNVIQKAGQSYNYLVIGISVFIMMVHICQSAYPAFNTIVSLLICFQFPTTSSISKAMCDC